MHGTVKSLMFMNMDDPGLSDLLQKGAVGVLPTDTVYGVVCAAKKTDAVNRLYSLKHREQKPGTLVAASIDQLVELGLKRRYLTAVAHYWPGPVGVVIPCGPELQYIHQGLSTIVVRVSADNTLNKLIDIVGPLLTSSANQPGDSPATTITEAQNYFHDAVDFYVNGGNLSERLPSTIIRVIDDAVEVLREGAVTIDPATGAVL